LGVPLPDFGGSGSLLLEVDWEGRRLNM